MAAKPATLRMKASTYTGRHLHTKKQPNAQYQVLEHTALGVLPSTETAHIKVTEAFQIDRQPQLSHC
jgi:hypothetical protein